MSIVSPQKNTVPPPSASLREEAPHVSIQEVSFSRNSRVIFDRLSLTVPRGKIVAIMGPSGSGKTTLLRLIGGQLQPLSGLVRVNQHVVHQLSRSALYQLRQQMGMLFQTSALLTHLSVFENVAFPLREHTALPEFMIRDLVLMKLHAVGLRGAHALFPNHLSGGMARRVALARAIALDPQLMMYDEPFTGLDPIAMGIIGQLIRRLNQAMGITSVLVSHDVTETLAIADYVYLIAQGKVAAQGTPQEMLSSTDPYTQQFIRGLPDGIVPFHYPSAHSYEEELMHELL